MNRINRRRLVAVTSVAATSAVLVACGNEPADEDELNPTQIPDVAGAPPTLAPITSTPGAAADTDDDEATGNGGAAEALTITMHDDFSFDPDQPEVSPGQTITVVNEGFMEHDLVSDELGIGTALLGNRESEDIVIPEDAAVGESFHFICTVAGHEQSGMVGDFHIVEASAAAPAEEEDGEDEEAAAGGPGEPITITMHDDFSFDPDQPEVSPGQTVTVVNEGFMQHDLVSDDLGIGTALLNNGESEDIVIPEDAAVGESFHFICTVAGHEQSGMVGDFHIVEGGGAAAATDEEAPAEEEEGEGEEVAAAGGAGEPITITMHDDFSFDPDQPEVSPGQTITVVNEGFMQHDLVSDDLGIGTALLNNGESEDIVIPEDAAVGESFHFICTVAGHEQSGMVGDFHIVEGGGAAAATGEEAPAEEEDEGEEAAPAAGGAGEPITINMYDDFSFDPDQPEVSPGQTITVVNEGFMQHDLVSDDLGIGTALLNNGESEDIVIPEDAAVGESFHFICTVAGHEQSGMVGDFHIVEGSGAVAAAGEDATEEEDGGEEEEEAAATPDLEDNTPMATTVVGTQWEFNPAEFEMAPGGVITFLNNTDMMMGISAEEWNVNPLTPIISSVGDGRTGEFTVPEDAEVGSTIEFTSNLSEAEGQGMVGTITIVEGDEAGATPEAAANGDAVVVEGADDFSFAPSAVEVSPGQTVTFINVGFMQHDLVSDDLGIGTELLNNGESEDIVIPDDVAAGETYPFICTVAGHEQSGMVGEFIIV